LGLTHKGSGYPLYLFGPEKGAKKDAATILKPKKTQPHFASIFLSRQKPERKQLKQIAAQQHKEPIFQK
jgi:hypothetical protein